MSFAIFARPDVSDLVERLSESQRVTTIVGAGSSIEAGFPDWETLVRRLLTRAASASFGVDEREQRDQWIAETLRKDGLLGAAAVVEAMSGEHLQEWLVEELFGGSSAADFAPGPISRQVALLRRQMGEHVRERLSRRGVPVPETSLASVIAVINTGKHVALVAHEATDEIVVGFAEILADSAAAAHLCMGWVNLYDTSGALVHLQDLVRARFLTDIWVVLTNPSPVAISRMLDDVRYVWRNSNARLVVATSAETLSRAELSPAARRTLIRVRI